ncbi:MAG: hypothetical protein WCJ93_10370 [Methanomicrobiales archaeon]
MKLNFLQGKLSRRPIRMYSRKEAVRYYLKKIDIVLSKVHTVFVKSMDTLQTELKPLQPVAKSGHTANQKTFDNARKYQERSFNLEDFGIREFNQNDDWIQMVPGKNKLPGKI